MITPLAPQAKADDRLPLTALAMVVVSFLGLSLSTDSPLLLFFTVLVILSQAVSWRLKKNSAGAWVARTVVLGVVLIAIIFNPELIRGTLYFTLYLQLTAQLCAGELVIQCWQSPAATTPRAASVVLLSGIVFLAASTDFNDRTIWYLTPIYLLLAVLTLRQFRERQPRGSMHVHVAGRAGLIALVLALLIGGGVSSTIYRFRYDLTNWFLTMMMQYRPTESTGIASRPQLGKVFELRKSARRVMKVEGAPGPLHLRGVAYDLYSDGAWGPDLENRRYDRIPLPALQPPVKGSAHRITVTRLVDDYRILFLPLHVARVDTPARFAVQFATEMGGPLRMERFGINEYTFALPRDELHQGPVCIDPDGGAMFRLLQLPRSLDQRVRDLARQIMASAKTPQDKVRAVEKYLTTHHTYALSIDPGPGDPVTNFLLQKKSAHCEYFASAATLLLRCANVPTRYVTGYMAHEKRETGEILVRERDAHAWAESYIDGVGWITVEATPGDGRPDQTKEALPFWTRVWEWLHDAFVTARDWLADRTPTQMISALGVLGLAFALIQIWRQLRAKQAGKEFRRAYYTPGEQFRALVQEFEAELKRRGQRCPEVMTWGEYACSADSSPALRDFVAVYNRVRFGTGGKVVTEDIERLRELLGRLKSEPIGERS
ncbi:MAG TPA: transglutaminaseTgpA domain-containing protein [Planctomycetota bacterium]|nr:transglutaminaseTgpA domain-containing protein [Planctomycetota bacterium]